MSVSDVQLTQPWNDNIMAHNAGIMSNNNYPII